MKFYSEILNRTFDTVDALEAEENKFMKAEATKQVSDATTSSNKVTKQKKDAAKAVELADAALTEAYKNYDVAKKQAEALSKEYIEKLNAIIEPAEKAVKEASAKRFEAIRTFNKDFGAYRTIYTGSKAAEEFNRTLSHIDSLFGKFFPWF